MKGKLRINKKRHLQYFLFSRKCIGVPFKPCSLSCAPRSSCSVVHLAKTKRVTPLQTLHWRWKKVCRNSGKQDKRRKGFSLKRKGCYFYCIRLSAHRQQATILTTLMKLFAPLESEKNIKAIINHSLHQFSRIWYYTCLRHAWATL